MNELFYDLFLELKSNDVQNTESPKIWEAFEKVSAVINMLGTAGLVVKADSS